MQALLGDPDPLTDPFAATHWYLGFGFGFAALVWNLGIAIVAGADMIACASGRPWKSKQSIQSRFRSFAIAQFLGAGIFGGCIGLLLHPARSGGVLIMLPLIVFPLALLRAAADVAA